MARCLTPITLKDQKKTVVPCGRCVHCRARRASHWSFRLMQETKVAESAYFLTLTYAPKSVPITKNGFMELKPRDLQLFFKRLRKHSPRVGSRLCSSPIWLVARHGHKVKPSIKYYSVGEYGTEAERPHYHIILFNVELSLLVGKAEAMNLKSGRLPFDGKLPFFTPLWPHGHVTVGTVNEASVGYTLKYVSKAPWRPKHRNDDRCPPFSRMSQGLGVNYLTPQMVRWHHADLLERMYCNLPGNKKISMPRYYKLKLYEEIHKLQLSEHFLTLAIAADLERVTKITTFKESQQFCKSLKEVVIAADWKHQSRIQKPQKL